MFFNYLQMADSGLEPEIRSHYISGIPVLIPVVSPSSPAGKQLLEPTIASSLDQLSRNFIDVLYISDETTYRKLRAAIPKYYEALMSRDVISDFLVQSCILVFWPKEGRCWFFELTDADENILELMVDIIRTFKGSSTELRLDALRIKWRLRILRFDDPKTAVQLILKILEVLPLLLRIIGKLQP